MAKTLNINVVNKVATYCQRGGEIVCGNSDYVIAFTFDAEWDAHPVKTARFIANGKIVADVVFEGTSVAVPIINNALSVAVGVFSGNLKTTTPAIIACQKSILCEGGTPADPAPDVYNQIIDLLNEELTGVVPTFEVDEVVTLEPGELAYVDIDNADPTTPRISFGIPKGESGGALPVPTENTEKKITESGYYVAYAVYSGILFPIGVFYYPENSFGLYVRNGNNYLRIGLDGSVKVGTISQSVNESGNVVNTETELPWYTLYTAKL